MWQKESKHNIIRNTDFCYFQTRRRKQKAGMWESPVSRGRWQELTPAAHLQELPFRGKRGHQTTKGGSDWQCCPGCRAPNSQEMFILLLLLSLLARTGKAPQGLPPSYVTSSKWQAALRIFGVHIYGFNQSLGEKNYTYTKHEWDCFILSLFPEQHSMTLQVALHCISYCK